MNLKLLLLCVGCVAAFEMPHVVSFSGERIMSNALLDELVARGCGQYPISGFNECHASQGCDSRSIGVINIPGQWQYYGWECTNEGQPCGSCTGLPSVVCGGNSGPTNWCSDGTEDCCEVNDQCTTIRVDSQASRMTTFYCRCDPVEDGETGGTGIGSRGQAELSYDDPDCMPSSTP